MPKNYYVCYIMIFIFLSHEMATQAKPTLLIIGHSFVRRMEKVCQDGHAGEGRRRYYRLDLDLPDMFGKVVFQGQGGHSLGGISR